MVEASKERSHGQTGAEEEASDRVKDLDKPLEPTVDKPLNLTRAFQRMKTDWQSADRETIEAVKHIVDRQIFETFSDAYGILYRIYDIIREKVIDTTTGEIAISPDGLPKWKTTPEGDYIEDWSKIGSRHREDLLYKINTHLFEWEQSAASIWGEALYAKAQWEEAFATGFDSVADPKATVDARSARANRLAADARYLAVFKAMYSKKADAIVRSLERLAQRLKDIHVG